MTSSTALSPISSRLLVLPPAKALEVLEAKAVAGSDLHLLTSLPVGMLPYCLLLPLIQPGHAGAGLDFSCDHPQQCPQSLTRLFEPGYMEGVKTGFRHCSAGAAHSALHARASALNDLCTLALVDVRAMVKACTPPPGQQAG
jgi:hypothetical protein